MINADAQLVLWREFDFGVHGRLSSHRCKVTRLGRERNYRLSHVRTRSIALVTPEEPRPACLATQLPIYRREIDALKISASRVNVLRKTVEECAGNPIGKERRYPTSELPATFRL